MTFAMRRRRQNAAPPTPATRVTIFPSCSRKPSAQKFTVVTGYPGGADIELAVERGEMQCRAISIPVYFGREPYHSWRQKGLARILVQTGTKRESRLADVPTLYELMDQYQTSDANRRLAAVLLGHAGFGLWPMAATPSTPQDQLKILRTAFVKSVNDPELLAEAKKKTLEVDLITGEAAEALAKEVVSQPTDVIARMKRLLGE
jgi:hypothetical protein